MSSITIKIHYNKKVINSSCSVSDSLEDSLKEFTNAENKKLDDFVFYYKGSLIQNNSSLGLNDIFQITESNSTFNIFAYLISMNKTIEKEKSSIEKNEIKEIRENKESNIESSLESKTESKTEEKKKNKYYYDVICPECKTTAIIDINKDDDDKNNYYDFNILNCENFHYLKNKKYNIYNNFIYDEEKSEDRIPFLRCGSCGARKMGIPYYCSCGNNLCQNCKETNVNHEKHYKIEFKKKNYYCIKHKTNFCCYCLDCNSNICSDCKESHSKQSHKILEYKDFEIKNINQLKKEVDGQKKQLDECITNIREKFNDMIDYIESYINSYILIEYSMINNYIDGLRNFQLLRNLNNGELFENTLLKKLKEINKEINEKDEDKDKTKYESLIEIYNKIKSDRTKKISINKKNLNYLGKNQIIKINYKINEKNQENKYVKLFDEIFVKNNKDKFSSVKINNRKIKELKAYYRYLEDDKELALELEEDKKEKIVDMSYMFNNCKNLVYFDFSGFETKNIISMEAMFQLCPLDGEEIIKSISSFTVGKLLNIRDIRAMFCKCIKINSFPYILNNFFSKDNKIKNISMLFNGCINLKGNVNIEKWTTTNLTDMSYMFNRCGNLTEINLGKINTSNVKNMCGLFNECSNLVSIKGMPLSTQSVEDISIMFQGCVNLTKLPDIKQLKTENVKDMSGLFSKCNKLTSIPSLKNWNTSKTSEMVGLFNECTELTSLPDISKWNMSNVSDASGMFYKCDKVKVLKEIKNWKLKEGVILNNIFDQSSFSQDEERIKKSWRENVNKIKK